MKTRILLCLIALAAACGGLIPSTAHAQDEVSFDFFYDSLRPYGDWVEVADYGLCWKPQSVNEEWAPYTDGYWSYTDGGWTWVSYEDFGGIVYHYGRWTEVEGEGWCWVPDYDWAPAWVAWRNDDEHVGWAPLPPECKFKRDTGVSTWVDTAYDIGPSHYHFCHVRDFGAPVIREVLIPRRENITIIRQTVNVTNITVINEGYPFCGGPRYDFVRERCLQPIPTLKLVRETNIVKINNTVINNRVVFQGVQRGNTISFPAPRIRALANPLANPAYRPVRTVANAQVNHGWNNVSAQDRQVIKTKFQADTKGATPETKKATPPAAADLKPVPVKADLNAKNVVRRPPGPANRGVNAAGATPLPGNRKPGTPGTGPNGQPLPGPGATPFAGNRKPGTPGAGPSGQPLPGPGATPFAGKGKGGVPNVGPNGQPLPGPGATPFAGKGKGGVPNVGPNGQPIPGTGATRPGGRTKGPGVAPGEPNPNNPPATTTEPRPSTPIPGAGKAGKGKAGAGGPTTRTLPGPSDAPPTPGATPGDTRPPGPAAGAGKAGKGKNGAGVPTTRTLPGPSDAPPVPRATPGAKPKGANVPTRPPQTEAPVNRPPTTRPQPQGERPQPKPQPQTERPQPKPQVQQQQPKPQPQIERPQPKPQVQQQRPQVQQRPQPQAQQPQRAPQPQAQRPGGAPGQRQLTDEEKKKLRQQQ